MVSREAQRRADKKWYYKNREKKLAKLKIWWQETKEIRHAINAKYRDANRLLLNEKRREYVKNNPEKWKETRTKYTKKHRIGNKEYIKKQADRQMVFYADPAKRIGYLAAQAKNRGKKLNRPFESGFAAMLVASPPAHCACCRIKLDYSRGKGKNRGDGPSIDRVDNTKGYVLGNVAIICRDCNTIKRNHSIQSLEQILAYMKNHFRLSMVS